MKVNYRKSLCPQYCSSFLYQGYNTPCFLYSSIPCTCILQPAVTAIKVFQPYQIGCRAKNMLLHFQDL